MSSRTYPPTSRSPLVSGPLRPSRDLATPSSRLAEALVPPRPEPALGALDSQPVCQDHTSHQWAGTSLRTPWAPQDLPWITLSLQPAHQDPALPTSGSAQIPGLCRPGSQLCLDVAPSTSKLVASGGGRAWQPTGQGRVPYTSMPTACSTTTGRPTQPAWGALIAYKGSALLVPTACLLHKSTYPKFGWKCKQPI